MRALILWNSLSVNYIKNHIEKVKQFKSEKGFECITNLDDFKKLNKIDKKFTNIYILAELGWQKDKIFEGYEIGYQILEKWNEKKAPYIEFFSFADRRLIYKNVNVKFKFIVKALPFSDVLKITKKYKFNTQNINQSKWQFFKYMAFTKYGIIDNLSHRLDQPIRLGSKFNNNLDKILADIKSYKEFMGENIISFISKIEYTESYKAELKNLLESRLTEITGEKREQFVLPSTIKILLIEDNQETLNIIKESIKRHYPKSNYGNIKSTTYGEEALNLLQTDGGNFDFVITDLELLDKDGFYQKVQGVDIFEAQKFNNSSVIGVVTGMGRKGISKLLKIDSKFILPKKHLFRNIDQEIDTLLKNLLEGFKIKEEEVFYSVGPKKGLISKSGYRKELTKLINDDKATYHDNIWRDAKELATLFKNDALNHDTANWNEKLFSPGKKIPDLIKKIKESHMLFLAHRLICLTYAHRNDWVFDEDDFKEHVAKFMSLKKYDTSYLTSRLGFNREFLYSKADENMVDEHGKIKSVKYRDKFYNSIHVIKLINLFPEEREWIEELDKEAKKKNVVIKIPDGSPIIPWLENNFKQFTPNTAFNDFTFTELYEYFKNTIPELINNNLIDRNKLSDVILPTTKVDQELNNKERRVIAKINEIYNKLE